MQYFENWKTNYAIFYKLFRARYFQNNNKKKIYSILENLDQSENLSVSFALASILLIDTFSR